MKRAKNPNAWMTELEPTEFMRAIREAFDFLCRDHGFHQPVFQQAAFSVCLSYRAKRVAVEVVGDMRDLVMEVALVRLTAGQRPFGWTFDENGRQFMVRLYAAAWFRKVPNPKVIVPRDASPEATLSLWLAAQVNQLRANFADVLADSDRLFDELNQRNK